MGSVSHSWPEISLPERLGYYLVARIRPVPFCCAYAQEGSPQQILDDRDAASRALRSPSASFSLSHPFGEL